MNVNVKLSHCKAVFIVKMLKSFTIQHKLSYLGEHLSFYFIFFNFDSATQEKLLV